MYVGHSCRNEYTLFLVLIDSKRTLLVTIPRVDLALRTSQCEGRKVILHARCWIYCGSIVLSAGLVCLWGDVLSKRGTFLGITTQ